MYFNANFYNNDITWCTNILYFSCIYIDIYVFSVFL